MWSYLATKLMNGLVETNGFQGLKHVIQQFASFDKSISDSISTEEQGWECLKAGLENQRAVFLAIDNVGDFERSREEARRYVNVGFPSGSKVLATARSREILKSVLGQADCCKPIPRLEWVEAATLFLSKAAPNISSVSSLNPAEREIVDKCLSECQFKDSGYPSSQYHPLVLRALGGVTEAVFSEGFRFRSVNSGLFKEFATDLVETGKNKEWQWRISESSNATQLKRLVLESDEWSLFRCAPRSFVEFRSLVFLELVECDGVGPDLELGSFNSLRVLYVSGCYNLKRVVCSCNNGDGDGMYCYKRNPAQGCMSELVTVKRNQMGPVEDLPFLRHCWNLQWFEMSGDLINPTFPAINGDPESGEPIDFGYLKALRTFRVIGGQAMLGYDCDAFIRWLLHALQLRDLIAFEYRSRVEERSWWVHD